MFGGGEKEEGGEEGEDVYRRSEWLGLETEVLWGRKTSSPDALLSGLAR